MNFPGALYSLSSIKKYLQAPNDTATHNKVSDVPSDVQYVIGRHSLSRAHHEQQF
jgi:hypothetical protein